jgi:predicted alpha/beta-fold hydrolase
MTTTFSPAAWLPGPHAQTIGARVLRSSSGVTLRRERIELPDGDFVDLDWTTAVRDVPVGEHGPLVLVLHGLEGSARSTYMLQSYRALARQGLAPVGLNFRSCSGEPNRLPRLYHSGDTGDIAFVLDHLRDRWPERAMGAVGFSLGGNALLKYLGEHGQAGAAASVDAAGAISVPYDLAAGERVLSRGPSRIYLAYLMRKLRRKVKVKTDILRDHIDVDTVLAARTFREFDEWGTAPLHGFAGADDYYRRSSSAAFLTDIRTPTMLVHALDDPFLPASAVPRDAAAGNPALHTSFVPVGGHVGFVQGSPLAPDFWAESAVARFLATRLGAAATH